MIKDNRMNKNHKSSEYIDLISGKMNTERSPAVFRWVQRRLIIEESNNKNVYTPKARIPNVIPAQNYENCTINTNIIDFDSNLLSKINVNGKSENNNLIEYEINNKNNLVGNNFVEKKDVMPAECAVSNIIANNRISKIIYDENADENTLVCSENKIVEICTPETEKLEKCAFDVACNGFNMLDCDSSVHRSAFFRKDGP
ncbi:hypothetical protein COBT_003500, partial [Conglomerata obtusa]